MPCQPEPPQCDCPPLAEHLRHVLEGRDAPPCPLHNAPEPEGRDTTPLNDNQALADAIGAALHIQTHD